MNDECGVARRGLRARADDQAAVAAAVLPARSCEGAGLEKAMDLLMCELERRRPRRRCCRSSSSSPRRPRSEHGITLRQMSRRTLREDLDVVRRGLQRGVGENWGFVPYSKKDLDALRPGDAARLRPRLVHGRRDATARPSASAITVPDLNQVLDEDEGPAAAVRLVALPAPQAHRSTACASASSASSPSTSTPGVAAQLYVEHFDVAAARPQIRRRDGLDPRDEQGDEPRHGGDGRPRRQALPRLRAALEP